MCSPQWHCRRKALAVSAKGENSRKTFTETLQLLVKSINIKQSDPIREMCCIRAQTFLPPLNGAGSSKRNKLSKSHPWHNNWSTCVIARHVFTIPQNLEAQHSTYRCLSYVGARHKRFNSNVFPLVCLFIGTALGCHRALIRKFCPFLFMHD